MAYCRPLQGQGADGPRNKLPRSGTRGRLHGACVGCAGRGHVQDVPAVGALVRPRPPSLMGGQSSGGPDKSCSGPPSCTITIFRVYVCRHRFGRYRTLSNNIEKAENCIMQGGPEKGYPMRVVVVVCGLCVGCVCVWVVYVIDSADTELIINRKLINASCRVVLRRAIL